MAEKKFFGNKMILLLGLLVVSIYFIFQITADYFSVQAYNTQIAEYESTIAAQKIINQELEDHISRGDSAAYIEQIARRELSMVYPGERVYYDITDEEDEDDTGS